MYQYQSHVPRDIHPCTDTAQLRFGRHFHTLGLIEEKSRVKQPCLHNSTFDKRKKSILLAILLLLENYSRAITITEI